MTIKYFYCAMKVYFPASAVLKLLALNAAKVWTINAVVLGKEHKYQGKTQNGKEKKISEPKEEKIKEDVFYLFIWVTEQGAYFPRNTWHFQHCICDLGLPVLKHYF